MGGLPVALADLNHQKSNQTRNHDYEHLKQSGYVRFLVKDEDGDRADAE